MSDTDNMGKLTISIIVNVPKLTSSPTRPFHGSVDLKTIVVLSVMCTEDDAINAVAHMKKENHGIIADRLKAIWEGPRLL